MTFVSLTSLLNSPDSAKKTGLDQIRRLFEAFPFSQPIRKLLESKLPQHEQAPFSQAYVYHWPTHYRHSASGHKRGEAVRDESIYTVDAISIKVKKQDETSIEEFLPGPAIITQPSRISEEPPEVKIKKEEEEAKKKDKKKDKKKKKKKKDKKKKKKEKDPNPKSRRQKIIASIISKKAKKDKVKASLRKKKSARKKKLQRKKNWKCLTDGDHGPLSEFTLWINSIETQRYKEVKASPPVDNEPDRHPEVFDIQNEARSSIKLNANIVSEQLALLFEKQGHYPEAIMMYKKLSLKFPEKNTFFAQKIEDLSNLL